MKEKIDKNYKFIVEVILCITLIILIIGFCFYAKLNFMDKIQLIDENILQFFKDNVSKGMTALMKYITFFGSLYVYFPLFIICLLGLKDKKKSFYLGGGLFLAYLLNLLTKEIFMRPRPISAFIAVDGYSFPSAHAMCAVVFYGLMFYFINHEIKSKFTKMIVNVLVAILILFIGISRIYLQCHYFTDVLMGYIYGIVCLVLCIIVIKKFKKVE